MIIYGSKTTLLNQTSFKGKCINCGQDNCVEIGTYQKYAHVFWIPFFPIKKIGLSVCSNCKNTLEGKEMPEEYQYVYSQNKIESKAPVWTWSGLGLLVLFIVFVSFIGSQNSAENLKLVNSPQVGDVYEFRNDNGAYTLAKVHAIDGDKVFLRWSNYEASRMRDLGQIKAKGDEAFSELSEEFTKSDLKSKLESGTIIDIER